MSKNNLIDNNENISQLIVNIGGSENIEKIYNCSSRIRIILKDSKKIEFEKLNNQNWNEGAIFNGKELHIVMGRNIRNFTRDLYAYLGNNQAQFIGKFITTEHKKGWDKFISMILAIIIPLVPYFLILGLNSTLNSLMTTNWDNKNAVLTNIAFFGELQKILQVLTRGVNAALPLLVCWTIFKLMKQPEILGMIVGLTLMLPSVANFDGSTIGVISQIDLTKMSQSQNITGNIFSIADQLGYALHLFGSGIAFPYLFSFDGQVVPTILVAVIGAWISVGFSKIGSEDSLFKNLFFHFGVVLCTFLIAMLAVAPIAFYMTNAIANAFSWLMTASVVRYIAPLLSGLTLPLFALFGLDNIYVLMGFIQYYTPDKSNNSTSAITTLGFFATYVMAGVAAYLAFVYSNRKVKELQKNVGGVISSGIGGVILPSAGLNTNLRHLYPWISTGIGASVGCLILSITQTTTVLGTGSFLAILSTQNSSTMKGMETTMNLGMVWMAVSILTSILVSIALTLCLGKIKWFKERTQKILSEDYQINVKKNVAKK